MKRTKRTNQRVTGRVNRKGRVRKKIFGTSERPRLSVFRSAKHIYAQVINDENGQTLAAASSVEKDFSGAKKTSNKDAAAVVGKMLGERAKQKSVKQVSFDRNGYMFHGRVKALADAARESGLEF